VRGALDDGSLDAARLAAHDKLQRELAWQQRSRRRRSPGSGRGEAVLARGRPPLTGEPQALTEAERRRDGVNRRAASPASRCSRSSAVPGTRRRRRVPG
jgi:hypothetical protein